MIRYLIESHVQLQMKDIVSYVSQLLPSDPPPALKEVKTPSSCLRDIKFIFRNYHKFDNIGTFKNVNDDFCLIVGDIFDILRN